MRHYPAHNLRGEKGPDLEAMVEGVTRTTAAHRAEPHATPGAKETAHSLALQGLLAEIVKGNDDVFGSFYDLLAGKIMTLVRGILRDVAQSEEVTQEVFVELWRSAPKYCPDKGSVTVWAMTLAHRRAVDRVRNAEASARRERRASFEASRDRPFDHVSESVLDGEDYRQLKECLGRLSVLRRESVQLAYYQGLTCREIAEMSRISPNTVKARLHSALQQLRADLEVT